MGRLVFIPIIFFALSSLPIHAQFPEREFEQFLEKYAHFSKADQITLGKCQPVAKALDTNRKTDVSAFGIIQVSVPMEVFVQRFQNISSF